MLRIYMAKADVFGREDRFLRACDLVDSVRFAKIQRCGLAEDKMRSLCCGLLLQYALKKELRHRTGEAGSCRNGIKREKQDGADRRLEIRYGCGEHGKPYFLDYPEFHFSLSHSGDYAALVFSGYEVGVDIQCKCSAKDRVARKVLSEQEYGRYEMLETKDEKQNWFFRCWCAKESYSKLTGNGLLQDFREISLETDKNRICHTVSGAVPCREYIPAKGYYMNVCVKQDKGDGTVRFPREPVDVTEELLHFVT